MKDDAAAATAAEDYVRIILLSHVLLLPPVLNTRLGAPYYACTAPGLQDVYFPSLVRIVFAQDLRGFQPQPGWHRFPCSSFARRRISKTVRKQYSTRVREVLPQGRTACCPGFRLSLYIILLCPPFVSTKWANRPQFELRSTERDSK